MDTPVQSEAALPVAVVVAGPPPGRPWYSWRRLGLNFLTLSILVHVFLGIGAAYLVVAINYPKKKTFAAGPPGQEGHHAAEHKVSLAKTQQRSSAPVAAKRVTTTGVSKVALPTMPAMPVDGAVVPVSLSGMGGGGLSGFGTGGGGGNGGGGGGGGLNVFGTRTPSAGLTGNFYDLKQTTGRQPTGMTISEYGKVVTEFTKRGFDLGVLAPYYKAGKPLYATRIFTPDIPAELGPSAFGVEKEVEPRMWVVHYKGSVVAPDSGSYQFAGMGDDVLVVKFNNRMVLDACYTIDTKAVAGQTHNPWDFGGPKKGETVGPAFSVEAGEIYPIEVLIGEQPGGWSMAGLLVKKVGTTYGKDAKGADLLPYFRMSDATLPPPPSARPGPGRGGYAPHVEGGPVWKASKAPGEFSVFSH